MMRFVAQAVLLVLAVSCGTGKPTPITRSFEGKPLFAPDLGSRPVTWLQAEVDAALAKWRLDPSEISAVWVGRRLAFRYLFPDAVKWFTDALGTYPNSYRLRRHLGHRLLTLREVDGAIEVLTEARELAQEHPNRLEPDGASGPSGEPRGTTHGNIDYHLAFAHYLRAEYDRAAELWRECLEHWARNDDARVAALHWLHTSLVRAGRTEDAAKVLAHSIDPADIIEKFAFFELVQLYRGDVDVEILLAREQRSASVDYGVARYLIAQGNVERGEALLDALSERPGWTAFGVLAAEADVARRKGLTVPPPRPESNPAVQ